MLIWSERISSEASQPQLDPVTPCCTECGRANMCATSFLSSKYGVGQCREELIPANVLLAVVCDTLHQCRMHLQMS